MATKKKKTAKATPKKAAKKASAPKAKKADKKPAAKKKGTKTGKALIKGLKEAKAFSEGKLQLRTTTVVLSPTGRPIVKDPPEKRTIPDYDGTREELVAEIKAKLLKMKTDTIEAIKTRQAEAVSSQEDVGSGGDEGDMAQEIAQQNIAKALSHNDELRLRQIDLALEKIAKGTYGICIDTEEEIEGRRLLANPFALRSIQAQEEFEIEQNQNKKSRGGGNSAFDSEDDGPSVDDE